MQSAAMVEVTQALRTWKPFRMARHQDERPGPWRARPRACGLPLLNDECEFDLWLRAVEPGTVAAYHVGNLAADRSDDETLDLLAVAVILRAPCITLRITSCGHLARQFIGSADVLPTAHAGPRGRAAVPGAPNHPMGAMAKGRRRADVQATALKPPIALNKSERVADAMLAELEAGRAAAPPPAREFTLKGGWPRRAVAVRGRRRLVCDPDGSPNGYGQHD